MFVVLVVLVLMMLLVLLVFLVAILMACTRVEDAVNHMHSSVGSNTIRKNDKFIVNPDLGLVACRAIRSREWRVDPVFEDMDASKVICPESADFNRRVCDWLFAGPILNPTSDRSQGARP